MKQRQIDAMRREMLEAVDLLDEAFDGHWSTDDALEGLAPVIADAESSPAQFKRDVRNAIADHDRDWLGELEATLNEQIQKADTETLAEYYAHFATEEE